MVRTISIQEVHQFMNQLTIAIPCESLTIMGILKKFSWCCSGGGDGEVKEISSVETKRLESDNACTASYLLDRKAQRELSEKLDRKAEEAYNRLQLIPYYPFYSSNSGATSQQRVQVDELGEQTMNEVVNDIAYYRMEKNQLEQGGGEVRISCWERSDTVAKHILNDVLTLRCPNKECRLAFIDYSGTEAVRCAGCSKRFCAWCLGNCEMADVDNCRQRTCDENGTLLPFNEHQRKRRRLLVIRELRCRPAQILRPVLVSIQGNLKELDIEITEDDVLGKQAL